MTGIGVVAPNGIGVEEYWSAVLAGKSGIGRITRFDSSSYPVEYGGEISNFTPGSYLPSRLLTQTDRVTQYALAATEWAFSDASLDPTAFDEYDIGVVTASGAGGFEFGQRELEKLWGVGPGKVSAYQSFAWFYAVNSGQVSIRHGLRGHSTVFVAEQAGGAIAVAEGTQLVADNILRVAAAGGFEATLCPWGLVATIPGDQLSATGEYRPFDRDANGAVVGEGGAIVVVERADEARSRGARRIYGRIAGSASTFDPRPGSGRPPGLARAMRLALERARVAPENVDVVFADAAGTPSSDAAEVAALREVFGPETVPVCAPKTTTGRLVAGGAVLDVATALLAVRDSVIPPTVGVVNPLDGIDLVRDEPRERALNTVMVVARGAGGFNNALVLRGESTDNRRRTI